VRPATTSAITSEPNGLAIKLLSSMNSADYAPKMPGISNIPATGD